MPDGESARETADGRDQTDSDNEHHRGPWRGRGRPEHVSVWRQDIGGPLFRCERQQTIVEKRCISGKPGAASGLVQRRVRREIDVSGRSRRIAVEERT